ncbi:MmgE/PrpD family protein [Leucobacter denitrificans]|uniref:MmgE/PrpD family protein n=1 Tax=Leucobacter denitrificans TaxID=683042 RepID=A0A7G9S304_9MICO|nr:MmgE/PrpD family protein [Leucobacter denitrificans]QNN62229.1 MmgE/PrpD family protein [Leucobacter denitrificans]
MTTSDVAAPTVLTRLADWISSDSIEIPEEVRRRARLAMLDTLGTTIGARASSDFDQIAPFISEQVAGANEPLIGRAGYASTADAAFINSFTAHLLDFDDSHGDMAGHPTAVVLPAALAVADRLDLRFEAVVDAYIVGVEVISRIGRMLNPDHYDLGWHPTATIGVFGAAAATARLLGLDARQTQVSLSLAAAFSSGIKASFGTSAKPLQVGRAAASGVQASLLAQSGATGRPDAFEHSQGYARTFERKDPAVLTAELDTASLGVEWALIHPGIIIKQYPCCGSTHSAIESAAALAPLRAEDIEQIHIQLHPKRRGHVDRPNPSSELDAKFSVQFTVGRALTAGTVTLQDFTGRVHETPEAVALLSKTVVSDIDAADNSVADRYVASVAVKLTDGRTLEKVTPVASGRAPGEMLAASRIVEKFENCVRPYFDAAQVEALRNLVLEENDRSVAELLRLTRV